MINYYKRFIATIKWLINHESKYKHHSLYKIERQNKNGTYWARNALGSTVLVDKNGF